VKLLAFSVAIVYALLPIILAVALAGCTHTQEAVTGAAAGGVTGAVVAGPIGAAVVRVLAPSPRQSGLTEMEVDMPPSCPHSAPIT
jgi:anaerobic C4-dicarboxylate transporter